ILLHGRGEGLHHGFGGAIAHSSVTHWEDRLPRNPGPRIGRRRRSEHAEQQRGYAQNLVSAALMLSIVSTPQASPVILRPVACPSASSSKNTGTATTRSSLSTGSPANSSMSARIRYTPASAASIRGSLSASPNIREGGHQIAPTSKNGRRPRAS